MGEIILNERPLTVVEQKRLAELETIVKENFLGFVAVGNALAEVNEKRLYRKGGRTFDGYCNELWEISEKYAYRLIKSASVVNNLSPIGDKISPNYPKLLPANEAQARELAKLEPEEQQQVWQEIIEKHTEKTDDGDVRLHVTAAAVRNKVKAYHSKVIDDVIATVPPPAKHKKNKAKASQPDEKALAFNESFVAFGKHVSAAHRANWRHVPRRVVFDKLSQLLDLVASAGPKEIKKKGCAMELSNREKLEKSGFRIFRMRPEELAVEESISGEWVISVSYETASQLSDGFKELLSDPMSLRG